MNLDELKNFVIEKLDSYKIENIEVINVENKTSLTKIMIFGTGNSYRHIDSSIENLRIAIKDEFDFITKKSEGKSTGWVLLDLIDIFVNLFTKESREEYKLEDLWTKEIK